MTSKRLSLLLTCAAGMLLQSGCVTNSKPRLERETGESVVFFGNEPAALAWLPAPGKPIRVRNTYLPSTNTITYVEGHDFTVNYRNGTLCRAPQSRIPDFRTNILYGISNFDHSKFPGYGNEAFLCYVDYWFTKSAPWPVQASQAKFLKRTKARLAAGKSLKIVAFGDSITAGFNVSRPEYVFWRRWTHSLRQSYPDARITALNEATAGDTTAQGLARLQVKVISQHPDLVLIGFGMNDHNEGRFGVPVEQFERNLEQIVTRIRSKTTADVILYSAFPPNPKWKFGSHQMAVYAAATQRVAGKLSCAYADVFDNWQMLVRRKKPEDMLANNINHPSDFGHWVYYRVFCSLGLNRSNSALGVADGD